jgi:hypothetical protein
MLQVSGRRLGLRGEVLGHDTLSTLRPAWEDLGRRSVEDNVYYGSRYAQALLETVEKDRKVAFAVVWDKTGLVALLPFTRARFALLGLPPPARGRASIRSVARRCWIGIARWRPPRSFWKCWPRSAAPNG